MKQPDWEKRCCRILIGVALLGLSLCVGYQLFFVPPLSDPAAVVAVDLPSATVSGTFNGKVHLNTASAQQLEELDGVGPALAQRILAYRQAHGPFTAVEQLLEVKGIGEKLLSQLAQQVDLQ